MRPSLRSTLTFGFLLAAATEVATTVRRSSSRRDRLFSRDTPSRTRTMTVSFRSRFASSRNRDVSRTACPGRELADYDARNLPRRCGSGSRRGNNNQCRMGYECQRNIYNSLDYICCRGPRCPNGVTLGQGIHGQPKRCRSSTECRSFERCQRSTHSSLDLCCPR